MECEVCIDGMRLELVSEFKMFSDKSGTDEVERRRKEASGRRVAGAIRSLVNARSLQLGSCMSHWSCLFLCMVVRQ